MICVYRMKTCTLHYTCATLKCQRLWPDLIPPFIYQPALRRWVVDTWYCVSEVENTIFHLIVLGSHCISLLVYLKLKFVNHIEISHERKIFSCREKGYSLGVHFLLTNDCLILWLVGICGTHKKSGRLKSGVRGRSCIWYAEHWYTMYYLVWRRWRFSEITTSAPRHSSR